MERRDGDGLNGLKRWQWILARLFDAPNRSQREPLLFAAAFLLFCAAFVLAYRSLPELTIRWAWLGVTAAVVPLAMTLSGLEYLISARLVGHGVGFGEALRITILASAANLLPIPGAVLVRTQALKNKGAGYGQAFGSTAAIGAAWVGAATLLAGVVLLANGVWVLGAVLAAAGLAAGTVMAWLIRFNRRAFLAPAAIVVITEVLFVLVSGLRMYATLRGLGIEASGVQAITLTVAAAVAAAAGIFPGGLGLRELLAGGLSPLVDLPAAAGILGAAVDRLIGLSVLGLSSLAVIFVADARADADGIDERTSLPDDRG